MSKWDRPQPSRPQKTTILLVTEGRETEPRYFDGLIREQPVRNTYTVRVKKANGGSALDVVQFAVKKLTQAQQDNTDYDQAWCVLDVESEEKRSTRKIPDALALAQGKNIVLFWSNPSFERWFLSHFEKSAGYFRDSDALIVELDRFWAKEFSKPYDKADRDNYMLLAPRTGPAIQNSVFGLSTHIQNGKNIFAANSASQVHKAVKQLLGV